MAENLEGSYSYTANNGQKMWFTVEEVAKEKNSGRALRLRLIDYKLGKSHTELDEALVRYGFGDMNKRGGDKGTYFIYKEITGGHSPENALKNALHDIQASLDISGIYTHNQKFSFEMSVSVDGKAVHVRLPESHQPLSAELHLILKDIGFDKYKDPSPDIGFGLTFIGSEMTVDKAHRLLALLKDSHIQKTGDLPKGAGTVGEPDTRVVVAIASRNDVVANTAADIASQSFGIPLDDPRMKQFKTALQTELGNRFSTKDGQVMDAL